jgi:chemotaxis protein methyltransferase CheR
MGLARKLEHTVTEGRHPGLQQFAEVVVSRLGFHVHQHTVDQVDQALGRCLQRTKCASTDAYLARFQDAAFAERETREIARDLTVPETYFFRHPEQFRALVDVALPERMKARQSTRELNVLSAGCATGEEAYSVRAAIASGACVDGWDVQVCGIDINPHLLEKARARKYSAWSLRALSETQRGAHFHRVGSVYVLDERLMAGVRFETRNLLDDDPEFWRADIFDVIFCRNVMIYLCPAAVHALADRLTRSLAPGGFLFLGPSETLRGISDEFHLRHTHGAFYYQRRLAHERVDVTAPRPRVEERPALSPAPLPSDHGEATWVSAIGAASSRIAAIAARSQHQPDGQAGKSAPQSPGASVPTRQDLEGVRDLVRQERFDDALKALGSEPRQAGADPDVLLLEAVARANSGDAAGAEQICGQLLGRDELRPGAHYILAFCQERRGDYLSAAEHDQIAIYLDPAFAMPHLHLGLLARQLGDLVTARRELKEALALLESEDASRILLFGGGFSREALMRSCHAQMDRCGAGP